MKKRDTMAEKGGGRKGGGEKSIVKRRKSEGRKEQEAERDSRQRANRERTESTRANLQSIRLRPLRVRAHGVARGEEVESFGVLALLVADLRVDAGALGARGGEGGGGGGRVVGRATACPGCGSLGRGGAAVDGRVRVVAAVARARLAADHRHGQIGETVAAPRDEEQTCAEE